MDFETFKVIKKLSHLSRKFSLGPWRTSLWIFSLWPIFLLVSQKYLLVYDLLFGRRLKGVSRELKVAKYCFFGILVMSFFTLSKSINIYSFPHFFGFAIFIIYSFFLSTYFVDPSNTIAIFKNLTVLNFFSLVVLYAVYFLEIDLTGYRGLNFIRGNDDQVHRFFIETSSLFLVTNYQTIRSVFLRVVFWLATFIYFAFIAKITLLIVLFVGLHFWRLFRSKPKFTALVGLIIILYVVFSGNFVYFIREDLILSILFKFEQLNVIVSSFSTESILFGCGYGFYLLDFATDLNQPYQIEMQLPMLLLQIGIVNVLLFVVGFYYLFKSFLSERAFIALVLYLSIGFVNPWLFLPVWFISASLFTKLLYYDKNDSVNLHPQRR